MRAVAMQQVAWESGEWSAPPAQQRQVGDELEIECVAGGDLWRTTSYGFIHDDGHGLLVDLPDGHAVEVDFVLAGQEQFDQAGLLLRADERNWVKAGVEFADGELNVGAVVTREVSDWSTWPVAWSGQPVTMRASRSGDAVTIRAGVVGSPLRLVRLAPIDPALPWRAGPFACAPSRAGLIVRFTQWRIGPADESLHE